LQCEDWRGGREIEFSVAEIEECLQEKEAEEEGGEEEEEEGYKQKETVSENSPSQRSWQKRRADRRTNNESEQTSAG